MRKVVDQFGAGNKFIVPLVVNGTVFVASIDSVAIFVCCPSVSGTEHANADTTNREGFDAT